MIKKTALLVLAALCVAPAFAGEEENPQSTSVPSHSAGASARSGGGINLKISYKMKLDAVESVGSFVTESGTQCNNVLKEDAPYVSDETGEKKPGSNRHGAIVNAVATAAAGKKAGVKLQAEMTELLEPAAGTKAAPVKTFQYQGTFTVELGRSIVLVDGPDRRLEMTVEELSFK
jgi:hypothetical protein